MNVRLLDLIAEAEARLPPEAQARLAELVECFVATHGGPPAFTAEELARLREIDAEPFEPADPTELAAFLARRG